MYTLKKKHLSEEHMASDRAKASFQNSSPCASKSGSLPDWVEHFPRLKWLVPPSLNLPSSFLYVQLDSWKWTPVLPPFGLWCSPLSPSPLLHCSLRPSTRCDYFALNFSNTEEKSSLFTDSESVNVSAPLGNNTPCPINIFRILSQSSPQAHAEQRSNPPRSSPPAGSQRTPVKVALHLLVSAHSVNKCAPHNLFSTIFSSFVCFWWFCFLKWPDIVLESCPVFLSTRRLACLTEKIRVR